ncbi:MAG TPA: PilZ domain-containing protein, partial [Planctomycetota bacterium]|nr:PilZ domain-containing protein [Planctomycetota bacterium]
MQFSKKTVDQELLEQRGTYRRRQTPRKDIAVHVVTPAGTFQGDFRDISVQGVGASFRLTNDPHLAEDDVVEVVVRCGMRDEVATPGRTVYGQVEDDGRIRYGFQFINEGNLYSQLDNFYARLFNRRGSARVRPALEHSVLATIGWRSNSLDAVLSDISATGAGITLPLADAYQLSGVERLRMRFDLPGVRDTFEGEVLVEKAKQSGVRAWLGVSFDF